MLTPQDSWGTGSGRQSGTWRVTRAMIPSALFCGWKTPEATAPRTAHLEGAPWGPVAVGGARLQLLITAGAEDGCRTSRGKVRTLSRAGVSPSARGARRPTWMRRRVPKRLCSAGGRERQCLRPSVSSRQDRTEANPTFAALPAPLALTPIGRSPVCKAGVSAEPAAGGTARGPASSPVPRWGGR